MSGNRRDRNGTVSAGSWTRSRAELRAANRRTRAMSHLQRVRRQAPMGQRWRSAVKGAKPVAFVAGVLLGVALASSADWITGDARIAAIAVSGARHLSAADVAAASGVPPNTAIVAVDADAVRERLQQHDWISEARALRLPSGMLLVGITEMSPAGRLFSAASEQSYLVDASGTPFAIAGEDASPLLPQVRIADPIEPRTAPQGVVQALGLVDDLRRFEVPRALAVVVADDDDPLGFTLILAGIAPRIVLGRTGFEMKLQNLAHLLATDPDGISDATELDLRFAGQAVLRNEPLPEGAEQAAVVRGDALPSI